MPRPILATLDTAALRHNYQHLKQLIGNAPAFAVIKADAYGHGLDTALQGLADADGFALIEQENALRLRERGWQKPILLLEGGYTPGDWQLAAEHRLTCVVHTSEQIAQLEATPLPRRLDLYVKLNTGMNRLGFRPEQLRPVLARLSGNASVGQITLMTHFARADEHDGHLEALKRFHDTTTGLPYPHSLANSAACYDYARIARQTNPGWARPGIMLYGASPFGHGPRSAAALGLRPVMTLRSEIIALQTLKAGETVGYAGAYTARRDGERIAVIACGYGDGYPRHAPGGTPVLVAGQRCPIVGRISMDKITIDVSALPESLAHCGAPVELWGPNLSVDEIAAAAQTLGYELLTALAPRVPRQLL